jgi:Transglutaminase-like superfamily
MKTNFPSTTRLILQAYRTLIRFEYDLARNDFAAILHTVRSLSIKNLKVDEAAPRICRAVDIACVCYYKQVLCLQRSAVTVCLLKQHGYPANLVLGAQHSPFKAHAWVELHGRVVNDKSYTSEIYAVLDRA